MGRIRNAFTKIALGVAAAAGVAAAIGSSAKKKYKESKESYQANHQNSSSNSNSSNTMRNTSNNYANSNKQNNTKKNLNEERRKQRENQNRIYELSRTKELSTSAFTKLFLLYLLLIGISFYITFMKFEMDNVFTTEQFTLITIGYLFLYSFIFFLIRCGIYNTKLEKVRMKIFSLKEKLDFLEKEKALKNDYHYADINSDIYVQREAIKNATNKYNKFINKFPNKIYSCIFMVTEIAPEEREEKIFVKCTIK